ncbi:MAG: TetR/AcrR family transcriptional regulator [Lactovum sp.]
MNNNPDLRVIKTKQNIKKAFLNQLEERGFEKITISSLTDEALVNRTTFYLHYKDKEDLMEKLREQFIYELKKYLQIEVKKIFQIISKDEGLKNHLYHYFEFLELHFRELNLLFFTRDNSSLFHHFKNSFQQEMIKILLEEVDLSVQDSSYIFSIVAGIQAAIIEEWILKENRESIVEITNITFRLIKNIPKFLLIENK